MLGPLNSVAWWEVPLGFIFGLIFFLQEQIKDIIIKDIIIILLCPRILPGSDIKDPRQAPVQHPP